MAFDIYIVDHAPMTDVDDPELVALQFMEDIGYIMKHYDPKTPADSVKKSVPYKLFLDCLLRHQDKDWRIDELSIKLKTSIPTIYRHLAKLQALGILDEDGDEGGKVFHLRHYSFPLAWKITEANVEAALVRYRGIIDYVQSTLRKTEKTEGGPLSSAPKNFALRVRSSRLKVGGDIDDLLPRFLLDLDYLADQGPGEEDPHRSVAYRLFRECFLDRPDRFWDVDELRTKLDTTRPTVYRHLNRLEAMGLMERKQVGETVPPKRAHRVRYGSLGKAWSFVEEYAKVAMQGYRQTVDHLDALVRKEHAEGRHPIDEAQEEEPIEEAPDPVVERSAREEAPVIKKDLKAKSKKGRK
jgi:DNA-binding transcriptional ArsR family regulator